MIGIDIPLPAYCSECPCSYYIQTGPHEGELMCQALEFRDRNPKVDGYLVSEKEWNRPEKCPMMELRGERCDILQG